MFNLAEYVNDLSITSENEVLQEFDTLFVAQQGILDDAYLNRSVFWGIATALENQITYLGGNLLPNIERRINILEGGGYLSQGDIQVDWFANEDQPHVNAHKLNVSRSNLRLKQANSSWTT